MRRLVLGLGTSVALAATGCLRGASDIPAPLPLTGPTESLSLARGDWLVGEQVGLWIVLEHPYQGPPARIGYVSERHYREVRGGPVLTMYEVTGLDRGQVVGIVDGLGAAKRFHPRRGGGLDVEPLGAATLPLSVQAIFGTTHPVTLERTSERALAFEILDKNGDKLLDATEYPRVKTRVANADRNGDGKIDLQEFLAADDD